jgi:hypothetical protein
MSENVDKYWSPTFWVQTGLVYMVRKTITQTGQESKKKTLSVQV